MAVEGSNPNVDVKPTGRVKFLTPEIVSVKKF